MSILNTQSLPRLVLYTSVDTGGNPELKILQSALQNMGFMGEALWQQPLAGFTVGDKFLSQLMFMGCSPFIELEPARVLSGDEQPKFCFIRILPVKDKPRLFHAGVLNDDVLMPRCPGCRKVIRHISQSLSRQYPEVLACPHCQTSSHFQQLDWRGQSGVGSHFIEVINVYPQEAIPTDGFLNALAGISQTGWQYFYTDQDYSTNLLDS